MKNISISNGESTGVFKVYPRRWAILITVVLLCMSNAVVWLAFFPVATTTSNYFQITSSQLNWFSTVFMIVPAICFFPTTYISNEKGLKFLIFVSSGFNLVGSIIKAFGTSALIEDKSTQYTVCLIGQVIAAVAQTFCIYTPTKVSQNWFPENERPLATIILSLGYSIGITLTQLITPLLVNDNEDNIPAINYTAMGTALAVQILVLMVVNRSCPKTAPSKSSKMDVKLKESYVSQMKSITTNGPFLVLLLNSGWGVGYIAAFNTLTQQFACVQGYSQSFSGSLISSMYIAGYIGAPIYGILMKKMTNLELLLKVGTSIGAIAGIMMIEVLNFSDIAVIITFCYAFYGFSTIGSLPLTLELSVETTYPVDETITTGLIYFLGQIFAMIIIIVGPILATDIDEAPNSVCGHAAGVKEKNYSVTYTVLMLANTMAILFNVVFFKPVYRRREIDQRKENEAKRIKDIEGMKNK